MNWATAFWTMRPAPQQGLVLVGEQSHREESDRPRRRTIARAAASCRRAPRRRRRCRAVAPGRNPRCRRRARRRDDRRGEGDGQVGGDRRLADAALARRDHQDWRLVGMEVSGARVWAMVRARRMRAALAGASSTPMTSSTLDTVVERERRLAHVALDLGPQGAAGGRQRRPRRPRDRRGRPRCRPPCRIPRSRPPIRGRAPGRGESRSWSTAFM